MKLKYFSACLIATALFSACTMDLDLSPKDQISDGSFWKTANDFELAANNFYGALPGHGTADNNAESTFGSGPNSLSNGTGLAPDEDGNWNGSYAALRGINYMLMKAAEYEKPEEISKFVGEAHFFRAWHYINLVKAFGGVPLIDKVLDLQSEELFSKRASRQEIVDFIIDDLEAAISMLPSQKDIAAEDLGRISKGAANALMSRFALYEGTRAKYHGEGDANTLLNLSVKASKAIMDSNEYALFSKFGPKDSYRKLFNENGEDCEEVILSRRYVKEINGTHNFTRWLEQNVMNPARSLVDSYLCVDGLPIEKSPLFQGYQTMTSEFVDRDPRLEQTILKPGTEFAWYTSFKLYEKPIMSGYATRTGYTVYKYLGETFESWNGNCVYDNIVFRYGEVLLNYAEAVFELGGSISDEDLNISINKLRDRVSMPHLTNDFCKANGLDMQQEIRRERGVELACEGYRYDDLIRWKTAEIEMPKSVRGIKFVGTEYQDVFPDLVVGEGIKVDEEGFMVAEPSTSRHFDSARDYLRPLPKKQIMLNPALEQNPNW